MKLAYARVFVRDMDIATRFYGEMLGLRRLWLDREAGHAGFDGEGCTLIVERITEDGSAHDSAGPFTGFSFAVPNIAAAYQELVRRGVWFTQAPTEMPWGGTLAYFRDYDGNVIGLVETSHGEKQHPDTERLDPGQPGDIGSSTYRPDR